jgi:hypothetical protein
VSGIATRIVSSKGLNLAKRESLAHIADLLGKIRSEVWNRYGSLTGLGRSYYDIRDEWMASGRKFEVPARLWKETLNDVLADIAAYREAAKQEIRRVIFTRTEATARTDGWTKVHLEAEQKRLFALLKSDKWVSDAYLRRLMRKHFRHGHTSVDTHIKLDSCCYKWFEHGGKGWIEVMSLVRGKRIAIPLASNQPISGTIRIIAKPGSSEVEVHHTIETTGEPCGKKTIGVDKGYTEAFADSEGERHGKGLGAVLSARTDANNIKYQRRNKIKAIAEKCRESNPEKCNRIYASNLGRIKLDHQKAIHKKRVETIIYTAANTIADKAKVIVVEDLTAVIKTPSAKEAKATGKRIKRPQEKRRLSGWVKGVMAEALENVSHRRGSAVRLVNSAYTSQVHSQCGCLAVRKGDSLYCEVCGVVLDSDTEAARVVLSRLDDHEIGRWTPFRMVKSILEERTSRYRLGLLNQDSSCAGSKAVNGERITVFLGHR